MRNFYQWLMCTVLALFGALPSQAQKRYTVTDLSTPLTIDEFTEGEFVINNGSLGDSDNDFLQGTTKTAKLTEENLYTVEAVGETDEGAATYRLKRVSDNTYLTNNNGKIGYTASVTRAWEFYPMEATQVTTDELNAEEPVIADFRNVTTATLYDNGLVFVDAKAEKTKGGALRLCPNTKGSAPELSTSNYATNMLLLYRAVEMRPYEYLEAMLNETFPNGDPGELYNSGDQPGCVPTAIYDEMKAAYDAALKLIENMSEDKDACDAALQRAIDAYEKAKANVVQVAEGYYYFRSARGENSVTYEDGANLRWVEDWTEPEDLTVEDAKFIWKLIENPKKKGSYFIQNVFSGRYVGVAAALYRLVPTTETPEESFLIAPINKEYFTIQSVSLLEKPFAAGKDCIHAQVNGHSTVIWSGAMESIDGSGWKFLHVDDQKVDALRDGLAQAQLNDALKRELNSAQADYAKGISYKFDGYNSGRLDTNADGTPMGLLTSLDQISTNAQEANEGPLSQILDNNIGNKNFFHSSWSADNFDHTNNYPYLQVNLGKAVKEIAVKMWPRINGETVMTNNMPGKLHVVATNTPDDDASWTEIGNFENALKWPSVTVDENGNETVGTSNAVSYVRIPFGETAYQYVRLEVCTRLGSTTDFKTVAVNTGCFNLSEIRVFESYYDAASSLNNAVTEATMTRFNKAMEQAQAELDTESATQATIDELKAAHKAYLAEIPDPQRAINALAAAKTRVNAATEGEDLNYLAPGAKATALEALAAIEPNVKELMTIDEVNTQMAAIEATMKAFYAQINLPENGAWVYLQSRTPGKASEAFVRSAGNGAAKNKWTKDDEYLTNRPEYLWKFIKNADGSYTLQNAANNEYLNTPRVGGSKGAGMSTKGDTCTFTIQNDLATEGTINLVCAENVFMNADPAGPLVTWGSAGGNDNSTFAFQLVDDLQNAYDGEYNVEVLPNAATIKTLPISVKADENCYSVIGRNGNNVELQTIEGVIEAGTPFIYVNKSEDESVTFVGRESSVLDFVYATEAKTVNGLAGTLAPIDSLHVGYGILYEGKNFVDAVAGDGVGSNSGYLLPSVPETTETGDARIAIDGKIDAIGQVQVGEAQKVVNVYTLAGVKVRSNVKAENAAKNLPAGLYIVGSKKVIVK